VFGSSGIVFPETKKLTGNLSTKKRWNLEWQNCFSLLLCNMYHCKWTEFYHIICSCTCMHWFCSQNNGSLLILRACQFSIYTLNLFEKTSTGGSPFFLICREFHPNDPSCTSLAAYRQVNFWQ
jgi:hypothetical protein